MSNIITILDILLSRAGTDRKIFREDFPEMGSWVIIRIDNYSKYDSIMDIEKEGTLYVVGRWQG